MKIRENLSLPMFPNPKAERCVTMGRMNILWISWPPQHALLRRLNWPRRCMLRGS